MIDPRTARSFRITKEQYNYTIVGFWAENMWCRREVDEYYFIGTKRDFAHYTNSIRDYVKAS